MPTAPTYPGVYIEEVPSGVHTILGVPTSITAFVGRALRGPVDEPVTINGFADFEREFGGLWLDSNLGYSVRDFFLNGGGQAIIVRVYHETPQPAPPPPGGGPAPAAVPVPAPRAAIDVAGLTLDAASPGKWGEGLTVAIDRDVTDEVATRLGVQKADLFNLTVSEKAPDGTVVPREQFRNLTVKESPRRIDRVLKAESRLVRWRDPFPPANPQLPAASANATGAGGNNGDPLTATDFTPQGGEANKKGLYALEKADLFNLLCIPPYDANGGVDNALVGAAATYCERRRAMLLVDPPPGWNSKETAKTGIGTGVGTTSKNAAVFFPRLRAPNPLRENRLEEFAPSGAVAGVFARTDTARGVWKAPAGLDAGLNGVPDLSVQLTDAENGELNPLGVNCLRSFPVVGRVVWGARTLRGADRLADEWKYIPVRRTALFIEESLYRGTQWVVFEPNDEPLWAQIRLNIGAFMQGLFRQGAFQGATPRDAYFVKCDKETTTQNDINAGIVNIVVGFAPLKPAEFVIIKLQQMAGQIQT